jgi:hypothetical protein
VGGEVRGEKPDDRISDVINQAREKFERGAMFDNWEAVAEAYAQQRIVVHVQFCIGHLGTPNITGHFCAVFDRARFKRRAHITNEQERFGGEDASRWQNQLEIGQAMLVNVGKLVNHPQGVRCEIFPSLVRLQLLDDCLRSWVDAPDFVTTFPFFHRPVPKDGKRQPPSAAIGDGTNVQIRDREFVDEIVQSGADIVDAIANDEGELSGRLLGNVNPDDVLAGIRIRFVDKAVWLSFAPPLPFGVKAYQVLPRPL